MVRINYGYQDALKQKRKRRKFRAAFLVVSSLVALVVFISYALFFSDWFSVKDVSVNGNKEVPEEEIKKLTDSYLNKTYLLGYIKPFSNILFTGSETIENSIKKIFPVIESVNVDKNLFAKSLSVEVKERETFGVWCKSGADPSTSSGQVCFYFDRDGILFKNASRFSGQVFLTIEDARNRNFNLADSFEDRELFEKIILTRDILDDLKFIDYSNFFLPENSFEFWIKTKEGWYIYFDKETDISLQLVSLKKFLEEKISVSRRQSLEYIDLRINNRIYYK